MSERVRIIQLPKIIDARGSLSIVEENLHIPFEVKRSYWIYDVPGGEVRGGHAFKKQQEFIIALSGSFEVLIDNGKEKSSFLLNRSYFGLFVPEMFWRQLVNFSTNSVALVLSSTHYSHADYMYDYSEFFKNIGDANK